MSNENGLLGKNKLSDNPFSTDSHEPTSKKAYIPTKNNTPNNIKDNSSSGNPFFNQLPSRPVQYSKDTNDLTKYVNQDKNKPKND